MKWKKKSPLNKQDALCEELVSCFWGTAPNDAKSSDVGIEFLRFSSEQILSLTGGRENARLQNGFPSTTKIRPTWETSFARVWETEQISKRNGGIAERPVKDRGKDAHQYDSLFGKLMLQRCLCVPLASTGKNMWLAVAARAQGRGKVDCWFKESPCFEKTLLFWQLWPTFTHSCLSYDMRTHTRTRTRTPTHAVTRQWRGKQRHLEKSSSGRHWHDLRGLAALPITLVVQLAARWLSPRWGEWWLHS